MEDGRKKTQQRIHEKEGMSYRRVEKIYKERKFAMKIIS